MNQIKLKKAVQAMIRKVLLEQEKKSTPPSETDTAEVAPEPSQPEPEEKPKKAKPKKKKKSKGAAGEIRIASGAVGSGRFTAFVGEAGARAASDPQGLMKDLGIKGGGSGLAGVLSIINSAIHTHPDMSEAYSGATMSQEQMPDGQMVQTVGIFPGGISGRNGIKFLSHTLSGAKNAGILSLSQGIEINKGRNAPIVIYLAA